MATHTTLTLTRKTTYTAALSNAAVYLDGVKIGEVANGGALTVEIAPGPHRVQVKLQWMRSKPMALKAIYGGTYRARIAFAPAWTALFAIVGLTPYLKLVPEEG